MKSVFCLALLLCLLDGGLAQNRTSRADVSVAVAPDRPWIEIRDGQQLLNFDFAVSNSSPGRLRLTEIEVAVVDNTGALVARKTINSNGLSPSVNVVAKSLLEPGETVSVFNPFFSFPKNIPLVRLEYSFRYVREDTSAAEAANRHRLPLDFDLEAKAIVRPRVYVTKTNLILPLSKRVFVWEGHDFYSHHRRVPLQDPKVLEMGLHANSNRYAFDFELIDAQGRMYKGDPFEKTNWYCYGATVYAPGGGRVIAAENGIPENSFQAEKVIRPPLPAGMDKKELGNYVLIDHANGEYSVLLHLLPGSVQVKPGDAVRQGQVIGRIGFSGDTIFPHLHYALLSGPVVFESEGIPASFSSYQRLLGVKSERVSLGTVDSGDILTSAGAYQSYPPIQKERLP